FDDCLGYCTLSHDGSSDGKLIAHKNCSQFCKCKPNGRLELHECAPNLHFNVENQSCMSPEDAKCKVKVNGSTGEENGSNDTEEMQELNMKGCSEKCPETNSPNYTVIIPHTNCSYFCKCNWGKPVVIKCPDSLHFNNQTKTCDSVVNANCAGNNVNFNQQNNESNSLEENSVAPEPTFNEETDNINNESNSLEKNSPATESTFNEESNNVNSELNFGTIEPNSNDQAHNNEPNYTEENNNNNNNNKDESNSIEEHTEATEMNSNKNNESETTEEKNDLDIESNNNNNNNNNENDNSTEKTNANDDETSSSIDNQNNIDDGCIGSCPSAKSNKAFALVHTDCRKYCICVDGFPVAKNCSAGLYFDEIIGQCVISKFPKCGNNNQKEDSAQSITDQNKSPSKNEDVVFHSNRTELKNNQDFPTLNGNWSEDKKDNKINEEKPKR
ncbi:probable serine/threonine-protein kinase dyrk1, partial [Cotesia glomerata]